MLTYSSRIRLAMRLAAAIATLVLTFAGLSFFALAQASQAVETAASQLPEPIYWKHDLFLVPYQWGSAAEPAAAQAVWLFVSKDRGVSWQKISEARPQVKAFNYRAEGDGEYWFAVRTLDHYGRTWPAEPYQPELRVIVDTMMPQIDELRGRLLANGTVEIAWRSSDQNLDANTWAMEAQMDAAGNWQPVPATSLAAATPNANASSAAAGILTGHVLWQPPVGIRPMALRATVLDRAGNSATYRTDVTLAPGGVVATEQSTTTGGPSASAFGAVVSVPPASPIAPTPSGWISSSVPTTQTPSPAANQPWPAGITSHAPFRLWSAAISPPNDGVTAYGDAPTLGPSLANADAEPNRDDQRLDARFAGPVALGDAPVVRGSPDTVVRGFPDPAPAIAPLEPFRQASIIRLPGAVVNPAPVAGAPSADTYAAQHAPPVQPKLVGSRTFALEYDLEDTGRWGVSKVELWGTRDGGRTWRSYARDDDHRSPLVVTVDGEGLYGFRIVVDSAGSAAADPPSPGDAPELWVAVDMDRPVVELTAIDRGEGNLADHLILRWQAADNNLEPRPIALFYSSRPAGPWSAIATNLEDTGEYAWRVERHVPARFYLRVEARDTAGNLAAFQTREPVSFDPLSPSGRLRDAESVGPTAAGVDPSFR